MGFFVFGVQTRDIYQVKQEMSHSSVTTTEIYAKFSLRRLEMDFPSLTKSNKIGENREKLHKTSDTSLNASIIALRELEQWSFKPLAVSSSLTRVTREEYHTS